MCRFPLQDKFVVIRLVTWPLTPSRPRSYPSRTQFITSRAKVWFTAQNTRHFIAKEDLETMKSNEAEEQDLDHRHQFVNHGDRWGTTDDFATSFLHFSLFSTTLWDLANSRPVHFLILSSHLFLCLPCLLPPFTVPCKMVLARPDERETWPYHCSLPLFTIVRRSLCGQLPAGSWHGLPRR